MMSIFFTIIKLQKHLATVTNSTIYELVLTNVVKLANKICIPF